MLVRFLLNEEEIKQAIGNALFDQYNPNCHTVRLIIEPLNDELGKFSDRYLVTSEVVHDTSKDHQV